MESGGCGACGFWGQLVRERRHSEDTPLTTYDPPCSHSAVGAKPHQPQCCAVGFYVETKEAPITVAIVGGQAVQPAGKYSFMASIQTSYGFAYCGGSVMSRTAVLTAAHCLDGKAAADVFVVVGRDDLTTSAGSRIR